MVLQHLLFIALGIAGLYFGGEYLVDGASKLARTLGIPVTIIGLTIVAFGTSMPELVTNIVAASRGTPDIAIGNILGSNIANIAMILGLSAVVASKPLITGAVWRDWIIMLGAAVLTYALLIIDGDLSRVDGVILFAGIILYVIRAIWTARAEHHETPEEHTAHEHPEEHTLLRLVMYVTFGLALLVVGAQLTVDGAVGIARLVGISELVIGVTLVAVGTSLPELATSVVAASKGEQEIAIGNVVGSNIFNVLCILGVSGLLSPFKVNNDALLYDGPIMLAVSILLGVLMRKGSLTKRDGTILLGAYGLFLALIIYRTLSGG
jgi:cation:H+ antiporter